MQDSFENAQKQVQTLSRRPSNDNLLKLYALYKQATVGDVKGSRPGMFDLKGRAKYDAWQALKGKSQNESQQAYIELVAQLLAADGK